MITIHKQYVTGHDHLKKAHAQEQESFRKNLLKPETAVFDFGKFHDESLSLWRHTTDPLRTTLKSHVRQTLAPKSS